MSYLEFHLVFLLPPIAGMVFTIPHTLDDFGGWAAPWAVPLISSIALLYTTPWDNYLVAREVWWYGPNRVLGTIGYVPFEEYLFFILQPVLTGLFLLHYLGRWDGDRRRSGPMSAWIGSLGFLLITIAGAGLLARGGDGSLYLGLVLAWTSPVLAGMWLYDGETLWAHRATLLPTVGLPTLYLWIADATAISQEIWTISPTFTIGVSPFGLPLEEATFFLMTNLLVVKGILLLLYGSHETLGKTITDVRD
ncbi:MAG: lycopene cyclase domain-containing protein [Bacteroidetes bacterium QH_1_61_8]|nr:MAG: lycopene cyclase domain-containing protein [Bacteroidetes bacterium QH_1_61_8]